MNLHEPKIAILGLGNLLVSDDGVGVHAIAELRKAPPAGIVLVDVGTAALHAQQYLEENDVVIAIDAVQAGGSAGSVYVFDAGDCEQQHFSSLHDLGILGVMNLMPEEARPKVIVVGVEPASIEYRTQLSPSVRNALPRIIEIVRKIVDSVQAGLPLHSDIHCFCATFK